MAMASTRATWRAARCILDLMPQEVPSATISVGSFHPPHTAEKSKLLHPMEIVVGLRAIAERAPCRSN